MDGRGAASLMKETGCDGVMIGRASQGNPFVFDEINRFLEGKEYTYPTNEEKMLCVKEHISRLVEDKGEFVGVREARKHVAWYIKGMPGSASMRNRVNLAESTAEMLALIEEAFTSEVSF